MKVEIKLPPDEFRGLLSGPLAKMYDDLVKSLSEWGIDEKEAKAMVAQLVLDGLRRMKEDASNKTLSP